MTKNRLYVWTVMIVIVGFLWIFFLSRNTDGVSVCLFKNITGVPCPSCGMSESVQYFFRGDYGTSLDTHPLGILMGLCMLIFPFWMILDIIFKKATFWNFYLFINRVFSLPLVRIILLSLMVIIWITLLQ